MKMKMKYTKKVTEILQKGDMMTYNELFFLLKRQVELTDIASALNIDTDTLIEWVNQRKANEKIAELKRNRKSSEFTRKMAGRGLTIEKYIYWKVAGIGDDRIRRNLKMSMPTLTKWKREIFTEEEIAKLNLRTNTKKELANV